MPSETDSQPEITQQLQTLKDESADRALAELVDLPGKDGRDDIIAGDINDATSMSSPDLTRRTAKLSLECFVGTLRREEFGRTPFRGYSNNLILRGEKS